MIEERECCGTFKGTPHRKTCAKFKGYTQADIESAIEATKKQVYQAIRDAETPYTQLTLGQQEMIKAAIRSVK